MTSRTTTAARAMVPELFEEAMHRSIAFYHYRTVAMGRDGAWPVLPDFDRRRLAPRFVPVQSPLRAPPAF
jgi:hypothetical protein